MSASRSIRRENSPLFKRNIFKLKKESIQGPQGYILTDDRCKYRYIYSKKTMRL